MLKYEQFNLFRIETETYISISCVPVLIPCEAYFEKNVSLIRIRVKTVFVSPKPSYHNHEKMIYVN